MPTMPSSVCTRTISVSSHSRSAPWEILKGWAKGRRSGIVSISVIFTRSVLHIYGCAYRSSPAMNSFRVGAHFADSGPLAVAELGVDLEILRVDASSAELVHHVRRDRRRKDFVGPRQHVEDLGAHAREVALGV